MPLEAKYVNGQFLYSGLRNAILQTAEFIHGSGS